MNGQENGAFPSHPAAWLEELKPNSQLTVPDATGVLTPFMKVVSSIKSAKKRHPDCQVVRRKGRIYVINKTDPRYKARQG